MTANKIITLLSLILFSLIISNCSDSDSAGGNFSIYASSSNSSSALITRALAGSPTSLTLNIYALYISTNEDCSGAVEILSNGNTPVAVDVYAVNTLFTGVVDPGEYKCIGIEMSDIISYRVNSVAVAAHTAACVDTATVHSGDLYRNGEADDGLWKDINGVGVDATGTAGSPSADRIVTFATLNPATAISGPLGLHMNQLLTLSSSLTVPGSATFFADFNDGIDTNGGNCSIEGGNGFGFR